MKKWVVNLAILVASLQLIESYGQTQVPCFFIFGDSLSDSGNNNDLQTLAKANFLPYGIDFPDGPTGRFTNGRTIVDLIGDLLGLDGYIPPHAAATESNMIKGVNYASGGSGIQPETGSQVGKVINMDQQLSNHRTIVSKILTTLGKNSTTHLSKCLYSVYVGGNDWMMNYFRPGSTISSQYTPDAYADALITQLSQQLTTLYDTGARKVIVFGLGPLGCLPNPSEKCSDEANGAMEVYNTKLKSLVNILNTKLKDAKFIWINTTGIVSYNYQGFGLKMFPCCGPHLMCPINSVPCAIRGDYAFWDSTHLTEAANKVLASRAFNAKESTDTYPMDIMHLAQM